ncbi:hypothetical protein DESUT3_15250 [Desulfuromonas versatilis]|uniref:Hydrogen-dependent growth transcriptional repressor n=1 Tax=Desulfuromonas versatilis TaxID=2802975 RepID=A0ABM8HVB0_9BACT|nr:hydrogen-dependent growth transcriptional repressor [Desulfuromonas versatilis]BCR04456.1 hypothetical protein DESUT3_15250 [Desulfuromonas versatilis]
MGRTSTNPKKFVISCRVNHREMQDLVERAEEEGISITALLRKCLQLPPTQTRQFGTFSFE